MLKIVEFVTQSFVLLRLPFLERFSELALQFVFLDFYLLQSFIPPRVRFAGGANAANGPICRSLDLLGQPVGVPFGAPVGLVCYPITCQVRKALPSIRWCSKPPTGCGSLFFCWRRKLEVEGYGVVVGETGTFHLVMQPTDARSARVKSSTA